jgi:hypothetical protein
VTCACGITHEYNVKIADTARAVVARKVLREAKHQENCPFVKAYRENRFFDLDLLKIKIS